MWAYLAIFGVCVLVAMVFERVFEIEELLKILLFGGTSLFLGVMILLGWSIGFVVWFCIGLSTLRGLYYFLS